MGVTGGIGLATEIRGIHYRNLTIYICKYEQFIARKSVSVSVHIETHVCTRV